MTSQSKMTIAVALVVAITLGASSLHAEESTAQYPYKDPEYQKLIDTFHADPAHYTELWRPQFHYSMPQQGQFKGDILGFGYMYGWWTPIIYRGVKTADGTTAGAGLARSRDLLHWEHTAYCIPPLGKRPTWTGSIVYDKENTSGLFGKDGGFMYLVNRPVPPGTARPKEGGLWQLWNWEIWTTKDGIQFVPWEGNPLKRNHDIFTKGYMASLDSPTIHWNELTKHWIAAANDPTILVSKNLREWTATQMYDAWTSQQTVLPFIGEGPDLFQCPLDGNKQDKLMVMAGCGRGYYLTELADPEKFQFRITVPEAQKFSSMKREFQINYGPDHYAQFVCRGPTPDGRVVGMGMVNPQGPIAGERESSQINRKFMPFFCMGQTFPVECSLRTTPEGIRLFQEPVKEIETLRTQTRKLDGVIVKPGENPVADWKTRLADIELEFSIPKDSAATDFGIALYCDKGGVETVVGYDKANGLFYVDRSRSGYVSEVPSFGRRYTAPMQPVGGKITMRILVDESIVEAFGNAGLRVITAGVFAPPTAEGLRLFAKGGEVRLEKLALHDLKTTWRSDAEENGATPKRVRVQPRLIVKPGETKFLGARVWPYRAQPRALAFAIDKPEVARLVPDGSEHVKIEALAEGSAAVTVTVPGTELREVCELVVSSAPPEETYAKPIKK